MGIEWVKVTFSVKKTDNEGDPETWKKEAKKTKEQLKYNSMREALISMIKKLDRIAAEQFEGEYGDYTKPLDEFMGDL